MDNLDTILFICSFAASVIAALLVFHGLGLLIVWFRERWERRTKNTPTPWLRRVR